MKMSLRSNSTAGAVEQIVVGLAFFGFYGLLIRSVGAEQVGVLSVILVLTTIGALGNAGFGSAIAHFIPLFEARGDRASTVRCVETTVLSTGVLYAVILVLALVPFTMMIRAQLGAEHSQLVGQLILPAVVYVFLLGVGSTTTLALTALHRNDLRLFGATVGGAASLAIVVWAAPVFGVVAGAWALVAQAGIVLILSWVQLCRIIPQMSFVPYRFSLETVRDLLKLGANMHVQAMLAASLEPMSRLLLTQFGSLDLVTYFSMAGRFVLQIRALIYASAQPLLAAFSHLRESASSEFALLYDKAVVISGFAALTAMSAATGASPFVGEMWIGEAEPSFVLYTAILAAGWSLNAMTLVAYFNSYSLGRMKWNLLGHIVMVGANAALGALLGQAFGAVGIVAGMALALFVSGLVFEIGNSRYAPGQQRSRLRTHGPLAVGAILAASAAVFSYGWLRQHAGLLAVVAGPAVGLVWLAAISPAVIFHPVGQMVLNALRSGDRRMPP